MITSIESLDLANAVMAVHLHNAVRDKLQAARQHEMAVAADWGRMEYWRTSCETSLVSVRVEADGTKTMKQVGALFGQVAQ